MSVHLAVHESGVSTSMMRADCLPISAIPHVSRLFQDYLTHFNRVGSYYALPPFSNFYSAEAAKLRYPPERRLRVADVLDRQNHSWGASKKTLENIARLRVGASAVVTGQQVSLFGGPMFAYLKALTAIKHAAAASKAGVDTVPIFWLATEDHDLAEVSSATLYGPGSALRKLTVNPEAIVGAPVGTARLGQGIEPLVQEALEILGDSEISDILRESYTPGATLGDAFARVFTRLFADFGLILIDAAAPEFHQIAQPVFVNAAEQAQEITSALLERGKELEKRGYEVQVKVTGSSTLLFALQNGVRTPVHRSNAHFTIGKEKLSSGELIERVKAHPEKFSANALMRPVFQDCLLPTLAYVGGPAEVAYFAQSAVAYEKLVGRVTPILPRISATLVEPNVEGRLKKYGLSISETFQGPEHLKQWLATRSLPAELTSEFQLAKSELQSRLKRISSELDRLDPTLVDAAKKAGSKMAYQLSRLQARAATAESRKNADISRHGDQISNALFANKNLQEREISGVAFLARHGTSLLQQIYESAQINCGDHQVFYL